MGAGRFWANVPMPDGPRQGLAPSSTQSRTKSFVHLFKGGRGAGVSVCQWQTSCEPTEAAAETQRPQGLKLLRSAFFEGELARSAKRKLFARKKFPSSGISRLRASSTPLRAMSRNPPALDAVSQPKSSRPAVCLSPSCPAHCSPHINSRKA